MTKNVGTQTNHTLFALLEHDYSLIILIIVKTK